MSSLTQTSMQLLILVFWMKASEVENRVEQPGEIQ